MNINANSGLILNNNGIFTPQGEAQLIPSTSGGFNSRMNHKRNQDIYNR